MALHLLSQFLYSISHHSLHSTNNPSRKSQKDGAASALAIPLQPLSPLMHATQSFTKVSRRWRCICSRNSSTASLTISCTQHNQHESLKKMALHLLSQFLSSLSHHSLHPAQSFTKVSKRWRCICSRYSSTASLTTPYMQHNHLRKSQKDGAVSALPIPLQPLSLFSAGKHNKLYSDEKIWEGGTEYRDRNHFLRKTSCFTRQISKDK